MTHVFRLALLWFGWTLVVACAASPAAPVDGRGDAAVVLTWSRDGGFAGFCDSLEITAAGRVTAASCRTSAAKSRTLSSEELARLNDWRTTFGAVKITSGDSGTPDGMSLKLTLVGNGSGQPSDSERQQLLDWAQRVYAQTTG